MHVIQYGLSFYLFCPFPRPIRCCLSTSLWQKKWENVFLCYVCIDCFKPALFSSHLRLRDSWEGCSEIIVTCCPNGIEPLNDLLRKTANKNIKIRTTRRSKSAASSKCLSPSLRPLCKDVLFPPTGRDSQWLVPDTWKTPSLQNNSKLPLQGGPRHSQHGQTPFYVYWLFQLIPLRIV